MTPKQQRFVECYCANGFNATQAALEAGYSEKTARQIAAENLTKPYIQAAISEFQEGNAERAQITVESISNMLERAYDVAKKQEASAAMVQAAMGLGKLHGLITDKVKAEVTTKYEDYVDALHAKRLGAKSESATTH